MKIKILIAYLTLIVIVISKIYWLIFNDIVYIAGQAWALTFMSIVEVIGLFAIGATIEEITSYFERIMGNGNDLE